MSTETVPTIAQHIVKTPGTCGGRARIAGHRITVQNIVIEHEEKRRSPADIVAGYPGITIADVHAALTYYHDHRDEIDAEIAESERIFEELRSQPSILDQARARRNLELEGRGINSTGSRP